MATNGQENEEVGMELSDIHPIDVVQPLIVVVDKISLDTALDHINRLKQYIQDLSSLPAICGYVEDLTNMTQLEISIYKGAVNAYYNKSKSKE